MSLTANNEVEKRVLEHVLTHASPDLMERISAEEKTIQKCWDYVTSYARKHAKGNQYCMTDEEAFGLVARRLAKERKAYNSGIKSVAKAFAMLSRLKAHGLAVVLPMNVKQLIDEGNAMHNCIGGMGYDKRICDGKSLIVFLYKDGKPFVDIEIDRERWTVRQCYAKCNTNTEEKINAFAKRICAKAKAIYRKAA